MMDQESLNVLINDISSIYYGFFKKFGGIISVSVDYSSTINARIHLEHETFCNVFSYDECVIEPLFEDRSVNDNSYQKVSVVVNGVEIFTLMFPDEVEEYKNESQK